MSDDVRIDRRDQLGAANKWLEEAPFEELSDSVVPAADGCEVEPDGVCEHGYESYLLVLGII